MKILKTTPISGILLTKRPNIRIMKYFLLVACMLSYTWSTAQPTISSLSATNGIPGSAITITGTNFNATPANNIVYFGATKATVTAASTTSLTVTIPPGATYAPVSVQNTATGLSAYTAFRFLPDFDETPYMPDTVIFDSYVRFPSISGQSRFKLADIDGDGKPDIIAQSFSAWNAYRNTSTVGVIAPGSLSLPTVFSGGTSGISGLVPVDIDGDGKIDVVTVSKISREVAVFHNTATSGVINSASFAAPISFPADRDPSGLGITDMDGDGKPDIVYTDIDASSDKIIRILRNTSVAGSISFSAPVIFPLSIYYVYNNSCVEVGDIDGDGKPDIVLSNRDLKNISVLRNTSTTGSITLGPKVDFTTDSAALEMTINDIDGDGKMDISVLCASNTLSVFQNTATSGAITTSSLAPRVDFNLPSVFNTYTMSFSAAKSFVMGDLDGDCKPDLTVGTGTSFASVFLNNSTTGTISATTFGPPINFSVGDSIHSGSGAITVGDFDGDTKPEIITTSISDSMVIFRNTPLLLPVTGSPQIKPTAGNIVIYPNPACHQLHLQWPQQATETADITISNLTGHTLYRSHMEMNSGNEKIIDISSFASGLYIVTIKTATMKHNSKLLIQH